MAGRYLYKYKHICVTLVDTEHLTLFAVQRGMRMWITLKRDRPHGLNLKCVAMVRPRKDHPTGYEVVFEAGTTLPVSEKEADRIQKLLGVLRTPGDDMGIELAHDVPTYIVMICNKLELAGVPRAMADKWIAMWCKRLNVVHLKDVPATSLALIHQQLCCNDLNLVAKEVKQEVMDHMAIEQIKQDLAPIKQVRWKKHA